MTAIKQILQEVWGYETFRPLQEEIISAIMRDEDSLAILPTGGGKSLCYQVPALAKDGICIVISPLIALMQDQVKQLRARNIKATMVSSGMTAYQIERAYGNAIHGDYKLLYISPERLQNKTFLARVQEMNVNLIAVDEAHCISQWGYDFRPTYQEISAIREIVKAPILALTATATPIVADDIQEKLELQKPKVYKGGIARDNISFQVRQVPDKYPKLLEILQYVKGTAIVYTMSRKSTQLIAKELQNSRISAQSYNAGLKHDVRKTRQQQWIDGESRIMVATNAFGMGIDKSNVRAVVHYQVPESIEAYYQEAGRAGRDSKNSIAVLLYNNKDLERLKESAENRYPDAQILKNILMGLFQYLKINFGDGPGKPHAFNIYQFAKKYDLPIRLCFNAIDSLVRQSWIHLSDPFYTPSRFQFAISNKQLYRYQVNNPKLEKLIKFMLRNFTGIFEQTVKIDEESLAKQIELPVDVVKKQLGILHKNGVGKYYEQSEYPLLLFLKERPKNDYIQFDKEQLNFLRTRHQEKIQSIIDYINLPQKECRMVYLQKYFGEEITDHCGICDNCLAEKKRLNGINIQSKAKQVLDLLHQKPMPEDELYSTIGGKIQVIQDALQLLLNEEAVLKNEDLWQKK